MPGNFESPVTITCMSLTSDKVTNTFEPINDSEVLLNITFFASSIERPLKLIFPISGKSIDPSLCIFNVYSLFFWPAISILRTSP